MESCFHTLTCQECFKANSSVCLLSIDLSLYLFLHQSHLLSASCDSLCSWALCIQPFQNFLLGLHIVFHVVHLEDHPYAHLAQNPHPVRLGAHHILWVKWTICSLCRLIQHLKNQCIFAEQEEGMVRKDSKSLPETHRVRLGKKMICIVHLKDICGTS